MYKSINKVLIAGLSFFMIGCHPESSNQYMGKYQYAGPPPDNKAFFSQIVDGKITTTPVMGQIWPAIIDKNNQPTNMKQNELYMLFGTSLGKLYNFDYRKANFKWTNSYNSPVTSSPVIIGEKVYFGIQNGSFYCIDIKTGKELWKYNAGGEIHSDSVVDETGVYFGTTDKNFYCLDPQTGKLKWKLSVNGEIKSTPLLYKDMVYFGSIDGNLYAVSKTSGSITWTFKTNGKINTMPVATDGQIYIVSGDKNLYALNSNNGNFVWSYTLPKVTSSTPSINPNKGLIYVVSEKRLFFINLKNGFRISEISLPADVETPVLNMNGFIYITDVFGKVYNIDETNLLIKWQFEGKGKKTTAPFLFNGIVHYGTDEGVIYAVGRIEDLHIYAPLMERTEEILRNRMGNNQFRMSYNIPSGTIPNGNLRRIYNLSNEIKSSAAFENEFIFVGADTHFYSLRNDSDLTRWVFDTNDFISNSPSVVNRIAYFGTNDGYFYALNAENKDNIYWKYKTNGSIKSSAFISNQIAFFGSDDKNIYSINNQGTLAWKFTTGGAVKASPVVFNNILYCGSADGYFYAVNALTGEELWKFKADSEINSSAAIIDNKAYFGSNDGKLYCLDIKEKGKKLWEFKTGGEVISSPAVVNNKVYFGSKDKKLYALDKISGKKKWEYLTDGEIISSPAVVDNFIYFGSADKKVYCLDENYGTKKWDFLTEAPVYYSPLVVNGAVYIGSGTKFYIIQ